MVSNYIAIFLISILLSGASGGIALVFVSLKKRKAAAVWAGVCALGLVGLVVAGIIGANDSTATLAQATASPEPTAPPRELRKEVDRIIARGSSAEPTFRPGGADSEPTDSPAPGPCDVQTLRQLDAAPGADVLAGSDPSESVQAAVTAERQCAESLDFGSEAYARHVVAEGDEYLLGGAHGPDETFKKMFLQNAISTAQPIADDSDLSSTTRAKAQEIIATAKEQLQSLDH